MPGTEADQLLLAEHSVKLNRAAQKGQVELQPLMNQVERLAVLVPSGEFGNAIVDALVGIMR